MFHSASFLVSGLLFFGEMLFSFGKYHSNGQQGKLIRESICLDNWGCFNLLILMINIDGRNSY